MIKKKLNINERISYLIEKQYDNNKKKFAESIGYSAQVVFNIVSGRKSKPSYDVLKSIVLINSNISSEWLLTGEGEMIKKESEDINYKQLFNAQVEIIKFSNERIFKLEKELSEIRYLQNNFITYSSIAEPTTELIGKNKKRNK